MSGARAVLTTAGCEDCEAVSGVVISSLRDVCVRARLLKSLISATHDFCAWFAIVIHPVLEALPQCKPPPQQLVCCFDAPACTPADLPGPDQHHLRWRKVIPLVFLLGR